MPDWSVPIYLTTLILVGKNNVMQWFARGNGRVAALGLGLFLKYDIKLHYSRLSSAEKFEQSLARRIFLEF
jgi:hypothetical protein